MIKKNDRIIKFCVLTTQRSGSTWLVDLINSHPEVRIFSEIFLNKPREEKPWNKNLLPPLRFFEFRKDHELNRPCSIFKYLNMMNDFSEGTKIVGFKLMYNQLKKYPEILLKFIRDKYRIIHLVRENILDIIVSMEFRMQKGRQHTTHEIHMDKVILDTKTLIGRIRSIEKEQVFVNNFLKILPVPVFKLTYDLLCQEQSICLRNIMQFLTVNEIENTEYRSSLSRINRGLHYEKIENYDAVKKLLEETKYYVMLEQC